MIEDRKSGETRLAEIKSTILRNSGVDIGTTTSVNPDDVFIRTGLPGSDEDKKTIATYWAMFLEKLKSQTESGKKIIGLSNPSLIYTTNYGQGRYPNVAGDSNPLTITTFDTATRATAARIKLTNGQAYSVTVRNISIRGNPVFKLTGDEGILNDSFIDDESIRLTGERKLECGNDYIFNPDQVSAIAQYFWDKNRSQYHIYTLTLEGCCNFLEIGKRYTLIIDHNPPSATSGVSEEISSVVEVENISIERSANDLGRTSVICREIEETWQKRNQTIMRCRTGGNQKQDLARNNCVVIASQTYIGTADYYCDGTDDDIQIQAAIDYLSTNFNGGTVYFTEGDYAISAQISLRDNIIITGTKKTNLIFSIGGGNSVFYIQVRNNVKIENFKLTISNSSKGISIQSSTYIYLSNLYIVCDNAATVSYAIFAFKSSDINIYDCYCEYGIINILDGLVPPYVRIKNVILTGNFFKNCYTYIKNTDYITITSNIFDGYNSYTVSQSNIYIEGAYYMSFSNNEILNGYSNSNTAEVAIFYSNYCSINGNSFSGGGDALYIYDCEKISIAGNSLYNGVGNGIILRYCVYCSCSTNTVATYAQGSGIVAYTGTSNTTFTGNNVTGCINGILVGGAPAPVADRTVVVGNRATGNTANFVNAGTNTTNTGNDFV